MNKSEKNTDSLRQSSSTYIIIAFAIWILSALWGYIKDSTGLNNEGSAAIYFVKGLDALGVVIYIASFVLLFKAFRDEKTAYSLEKDGGKNPFAIMPKLVIAFPVLSVLAALGYLIAAGINAAYKDISPDEAERAMKIMLGYSKAISDLFAITNVVGIFSFKVYRYEQQAGREGETIAKLAFLGAVVTALDLVVGVVDSFVRISSIIDVTQSAKSLPRYLIFGVTMLMCVFQLLLYIRRRSFYTPVDENAYAADTPEK
jgi:hypothetical protein